MAKLTIREAARIVGRDRTTLYRYIQSGELSMEVEQCGKERIRMVDTAELERVFGPLRDPAQQPQPGAEQLSTTLEQQTGFAVAISSLQQQVQLLQKELELSHEREADLRRRLDLAEIERRQVIQQLTDQRQQHPKSPKSR